MEGQNDKVHLKNIKLFRIIPKKKKSLIFFKNFWGAKAPLGPADHLQLVVASNKTTIVICKKKITTLTPPPPPARGGKKRDKNDPITPTKLIEWVGLSTIDAFSSNAFILFC